MKAVILAGGKTVSNFFSLSVLQGANYILPLITLPYLVRVLGVKYYAFLCYTDSSLSFRTMLC